MTTKFAIIPLVLFLLALLAACSSVSNTPVDSPVPEMTATISAPFETPFRIIGYFTDAGIVEIVPFERLTHINYAFIIPNEDGSLQPIANSWKLRNLVETAHQHGVQVLPSVGGWGWDAEFEAMATDPVARQAFIKNILAIVEEYNLDGVDMDWEYPDAGQSAQNYAMLMRELRNALPEGKLLTAAVPALGSNADNFLPETFADVDFLNVMVYDGDHGAGHSPYRYAVDSLAYWSAQGLPKEKTVLGVPFYAHPGSVIYRKLVNEDPTAAQRDSMEYSGATVYYNGIPTIIEKTKLAMEKASGVMFWTLEGDTTDETSLIKAIYDTAYGK